MILQQLKRGSVVINEIVKNDITTFSTTEMTDLKNSPIALFLNKYMFYSEYFKSGFISGLQPYYKTVSELPFIDANGNTVSDPAAEIYYTNVWSDIWNAFVKKPTFDPYSKKIFKTFIYDFFRAYILQYGIQGATTTEGKIATLYPYWLRYIGSIKIRLPGGAYLKKENAKQTQTSTSPTTTVANATTIFGVLDITEAKLKAYALDTSATPAIPA